VSFEKVVVFLNVGDTARSAVFYQALLGAAPAHQSPSRATFELESPPLILNLHAVARAEGTRPRRLVREVEGPAVPRPRPAAKGGAANASFTLIVNEPKHVGDTAIALRRAGVPIRIEDHGIETRDPDRNAWHVRLVASAPGRAVIETQPLSRARRADELRR
jgi:catechol 2,3-dioxygenase-like lactoylglutathione lyase family enzyme